MLRSCRRRGWLFNLQHRGCKILCFVGCAQLLCTTIIYYLIGFGSDYGAPSGESLNIAIDPVEFVAFDVATNQNKPSPPRLSVSMQSSTGDPISKFARSAISRAKSQECKEGILDIDRRQTAGQLYENNLLKGSCPFRNITLSRFVGCFRDTVNLPDLDAVKSKEFVSDNSPSRCVEYCFSLGLPYAGVQRGTTCHCGSRFGRHGALPVSRCDRPCPGNVTLKCGGNLANSVYTTEAGATVNFIAPRQPSNSSKAATVPSRIAFIMSLNGRSLRQAGRQLRAIYRPEHYYFIHVDSRLKYLHHELEKMTKGVPNIYLAQDDQRFSSIWGGASLLTMLLSSYKYLVSRTDWAWDVTINLSETDFPIRPVEDLALFLGANKKASFLLTHLSKTDVYMSKQGLHYTFFECEHRMWRLNERSLPRGVRIFGASDWVTLTREFTEYIINGLQNRDPFLVGLEKLFNYTLLPAESYFHTVALNTHFCDKVANSNLRVVNWQRSRGCRCQQKAIVDWCGCSPNNLLEKDFRNMMVYSASRSPGYFFARKFEEAIDQKILNLVEINLLHTLSENTSALNHFWLNEFSLEADGPNSGSFLRRQPFYLSFAHLAVRSLLPKSDYTVKKLCPTFDVGEILSANSFKVDSVFQGLLVEFSSGNYKFETMIVESEAHRAAARAQATSIDTITNPVLESLFSTWGFRVASIQIGSEFDLKELVFRNIGSLFVTNQTGVCAALAWEKVAMRDAKTSSLGPNATTTTTSKMTTTTKPPTVHVVVSISAPDGMETHCSVETHPTDEVTCLCSDAFRLTRPGIWQLSVRSAGSSHPNVNFGDPISFLVLPDKFARASVDMVSPSFWSFHDICVAPSSSAAIGELRTSLAECFSPEPAPSIDPCTSKSWSSYSADIKSLPKFF